MNFLAHIYLSMDDEEIMVANFMADSVRKVQVKNYTQKFQKGFALHHFIDHYTDHHPLVKEAQSVLTERHGKYASVLTDLFFDHFLARDWEEWHPLSLNEFTQNFYGLLDQFNTVLTPRIKHLKPYMVRGNWLYNYQYIDGMRRVLGGMSRRARFTNKMNEGIQDLEKHYLFFESIFNRFFPELIAGSNAFLLEDQKTN